MKLTQTDRRDIVAELQTKKATMTELAERYKVSIAAIGYVFKKMTGNGLKPPLSQSDREAIVATLQSGKATIEELATKYGVRRGTISRTFKQTTGTSLHPRKLSQADKAAIVAALKAGTEPKELAPKYDVGSSYIGTVYKQETGMLRKLPFLSQSEKETIVAAVQSGKASQRKLAAQFHINRSRVSSVLKEASALQESRYRAWQKKQKKMYPVFGIDWFNRKIFVPTDVSVRWYRMDHFIMMEYSGLRDSKRTSEYPEGQKIYAGDIIRFPINLDGKKTMVIDKVILDTDGVFTVTEEADYDMLAVVNNECEIIGNRYENPELISEAA